MEKNPEEIGRRLETLNLWEMIAPYNWAIKPHGTAFPYFCSTIRGDGQMVKVRFLLLEGWQTLHDYVRTRVDRNFGFYSTPMELPHFELVVFPNHEVKVYRHDAGYLPRELTESERTLVGRLLWEAYGVVIRLESESNLSIKFSEQQAMFARVETEPDVWEDAPLVIPDARPHVEKIAFAKQDIAQAKDLPFASEEAMEVDFRLMPGLMTKDVRPRCAYVLAAVDGGTGERIISDKLSVQPDGSLKELWESIPERILKHLLARGRIPGQIKVISGRLFRMLRPLGVELPFKLSLHEALPRLENAFKI